MSTDGSSDRSGESSAAPAVSPRQADDPSRRELLKKAAATCLGTAAIAVPVVAGGAFALDPLLRTEGQAGDGAFHRVAPLAAVVPGAPPRSFPVIADREDAWNRTPNVEIGSVLLFREADDDETVMAWSTICPHIGCRIDWKDEAEAFFCPCHASLFAPDGSRENDISPRDMDRLETEIRGDEIWVRYRRFKTGTAEQIAV